MPDSETIVAFNRSGKFQTIRLSLNTEAKLEFLAESRPGSLAKPKQNDREIRFELAPLSGVAFGTVQ